MDKLTDYLIIACKSVAVYLFIIAAIRIFGKKELAQLSVVDLVFILLISNSVQNAMVGNDSTLPGGIIAALGLFIANYILKLLFRSSPWFSKAVQGEKIILIQDGQILRHGLNRASMTMEELKMAVREHGVDSVTEVDLAILEVDGNISVLSDNYKHKTIKRRKKPELSHNP